MLGNDHSGCADQRIGPKRRGFLKLNSYRMAVHFGDLHIAVRAFGVSGGCWVGRIGRCKHHIICSKRFAVVPEHVSLELPGDSFAVTRNTAVGRGGNFCRQNGHHVAVVIPGSQRFVKNTRSLLIFGTAGKVGL